MLSPHAPVCKADFSLQSTEAGGRGSAWSLKEGAVRLAGIRRPPQGKGRKTMSSPVAFLFLFLFPSPQVPTIHPEHRWETETRESLSLRSVSSELRWVQSLKPQPR